MTELTMTTSAEISAEISAETSATGSTMTVTPDSDTGRADDDASPRGERLYGDDHGMSTIEYALGCVAAAALGALLYLVVTSDSVEAALTGIFERALETK